MNGGGIFAVGRGVHYETIRWTVTDNPWLILTNRFEIRNDGLIAAFSGAAPDVLFISGNVFQGWTPSPLGLVMLAVGMILVLGQLQG